MIPDTTTFWTSGTAAAIVSAVAVILTTIIVQRITSRNARRAHELAEHAQERKDSLEQINSWRTDVSELRRERVEMRTEISEMRNAINDLETQVADLKLHRRLDQKHIDELVSWCRVVVVLLRQHGIPYPPLPPGVTDTNPRGISSQGIA